mmetsp:Transcript_20345/g.30090  ORF Transcript_20345/g.30090 Transcript_20345/m.30090 type:complete len:560 (-) Transcript_20345:70-1749(-)
MISKKFHTKKLIRIKRKTIYLKNKQMILKKFHRIKPIQKKEGNQKSKKKTNEDNEITKNENFSNETLKNERSGQTRLSREEKDQILRDTIERQQKMMAKARGIDPDKLDPTNLAIERARQRQIMEAKTNTIMPSTRAADDYFNSLKQHSKKMSEERKLGFESGQRSENHRSSSNASEEYIDSLKHSKEIGERKSEIPKETVSTSNETKKEVTFEKIFSYTEKLQMAKQKNKKSFSSQNEKSSDYVAQLNEIIEMQKTKNIPKMIAKGSNENVPKNSEIQIKVKSSNENLPKNLTNPTKVKSSNDNFQANLKIPTKVSNENAPIEEVISNAMSLLNEQIKTEKSAVGLRKSLIEVKSAIQSEGPLKISQKPQTKEWSNEMSAAEMISLHETTPLTGQNLLALRKKLNDLLADIDQRIEINESEKFLNKNLKQSEKSNEGTMGGEKTEEIRREKIGGQQGEIVGEKDRNNAKQIGGEKVVKLKGKIEKENAGKLQGENEGKLTREKSENTPLDDTLRKTLGLLLKYRGGPGMGNGRISSGDFEVLQNSLKSVLQSLRSEIE